MSTKDHHSIDLAGGVGAGILFDSLLKSMRKKRKIELFAKSPDGTTDGVL